MRKLCMTGATLALFLLCLGFLGARHPAFDTLALGRPIFALVCVLGVLASRTWRWRLGFGAGPLLAVLSMVPFLRPQTEGTDVTLYTKNMHHRHIDEQKLIADIRAAHVEIVMLQEVGIVNTDMLHQLLGDFPHQHICQFNNTKGIAVLSRMPFTGKTVCSERRALAAAQILMEGQPLWAVSVHIPWLWPYQVPNAERGAFEVIADLDGPVVLAGDFNALPWTARVTGLAKATATTYAGPLQHTYTLFRTPISIDHVLAPGGGTVERRPLFGSDHAGLLARVNL